MESYKTVLEYGADEFVEKRSRFIGYCTPVTTQEEAIAFISQIKEKHWDATHNVYAYCLRDGQIKRYSDDGEPQGTAGIPVLDVIEKTGLVNTAVVVTRYFGGTMLGAGGLVRAYSHGAKLAVEAAGIITMEKGYVCRVNCSYTQYGKLSGLIPDCGGTITQSDFGQEVSVAFYIGTDLLDTLHKKIADATNGQRQAEVTGEQFFVKQQ